MPEFIRQLDDGALWLAAVVAGLTAFGWLTRKMWRGYRNLNAFLQKADALLDIAEYELQHNGGGSIKDSVSKIPALRAEVGALGANAAALQRSLNSHIEQARDIHDEQAAAIAHLAEALPVVARSKPHPDDVAP